MRVLLLLAALVAQATAPVPVHSTVRSAFDSHVGSLNGFDSSGFDSTIDLYGASPQAEAKKSGESIFLAKSVSGALYAIKYLANRVYNAPGTTIPSATTILTYNPLVTGFPPKATGGPTSVMGGAFETFPLYPASGEGNEAGRCGVLVGYNEGQDFEPTFPGRMGGLMLVDLCGGTGDSTNANYATAASTMKTYFDLTEYAVGDRGQPPAVSSATYYDGTVNDPTQTEHPFGAPNGGRPAIFVALPFTQQILMIAPPDGYYRTWTAPTVWDAPNDRFSSVPGYTASIASLDELNKVLKSNNCNPTAIKVAGYSAKGYQSQMIIGCSRFSPFDPAPESGLLIWDISSYTSMATGPANVYPVDFCDYDTSNYVNNTYVGGTCNKVPGPEEIVSIDVQENMPDDKQRLVLGVGTLEGDAYSNSVVTVIVDTSSTSGHYPSAGDRKVTFEAVYPMGSASDCALGLGSAVTQMNQPGNVTDNVTDYNIYATCLGGTTFYDFFNYPPASPPPPAPPAPPPSSPPPPPPPTSPPAPPKCTNACQSYRNGADPTSKEYSALCMKEEGDKMVCIPRTSKYCDGGMEPCRPDHVPLPTAMCTGPCCDEAGKWADTKCGIKMTKGKCGKKKISQKCKKTCGTC